MLVKRCIDRRSILFSHESYDLLNTLAAPRVVPCLESKHPCQIHEKESVQCRLIGRLCYDTDTLLRPFLSANSLTCRL